MELSVSKSSNKTVLWIVGGCLAILICGLAGFLFGFGGLYWLGSQVADEVNVDWEIPAGVEVDANVEFKIRITNVTPDPVQLVDIDLPTDYLHGFLIETTDPVYIDTYEYTEFGGEQTFQTYSFNQSIDPGETLTVTFSGKAIVAGDYSGTVAVCINSSVNCKNDVVRTIIK
jgi:hypothetical protein